ncbi:MAG: GDP-L-fucose synthase [Hyphomonas sp.]|nr:GDP-L-fucose synthase [Hyphomonas sp.]
MQQGRRKVFVAGHRGMVGSAIVRNLSSSSDVELLVRDRARLDLRDQSAVNAFFAENQIDEVYLAAAKVGGIVANRDYPADFIAENLAIQTNVILAAHITGVDKLLFIASSAIYPKQASQPISEMALLTASLDPMHEPYALAKLAGLVLCRSLRQQDGRDFRCVVPTNLYGPGDNFHEMNSHVIPGLIRRFWEAKSNEADTVVIWGTGSAKREFMHVDDLAAACTYILNLSQSKFCDVVDERHMHLNIGTGMDHEIREIALRIAAISKFQGRLEFDAKKPDGVPRKLLDSARLRQLGWEPKIPIDTGLNRLYDWFVAQNARARK